MINNSIILMIIIKFYESKEILNRKKLNNKQNSINFETLN